jgi:hypothetical protein
VGQWRAEPQGTIDVLSGWVFCKQQVERNRQIRKSPQYVSPIFCPYLTVNGNSPLIAILTCRFYAISTTISSLKPQPTLWAIIKIFRSLIATITTTLKETSTLTHFS